jgi:hypothetical protein
MDLKKSYDCSDIKSSDLPIADNLSFISVRGTSVMEN